MTVGGRDPLDRHWSWPQDAADLASAESSDHWQSRQDRLKFGCRPGISPRVGNPRRAEDKLGTSSEREFSTNGRQAYHPTCQRPQQLGFLDPGEIPPLPCRMSSTSDSGPLGLRSFRTRASEVKLDHLSLPRTFFVHSEIANVLFREADLSESCLCWNDFSKCDLTARTCRRAACEHPTSPRADSQGPTSKARTFADRAFGGVISPEPT